MGCSQQRISAALVVALLLSCCGGAAAAVNSTSGAPVTISAKSAILWDADSGRVLFEKNARTQMPMASTTKIMTAVTALETADLGSTVTVSKQATLVEGTKMYLREGEEISLHDLLFGLMLTSGNDAALAIAEHCGGLDRFVSQMNRIAREIGMESSSFDNPHGLDSTLHFTTAYDMALLTQHALKNELFAEIVGTKKIVLAGRLLNNHNKLLSRYEGCDGVKTGFTKKSGRCLVSSATRDGRRLIVVTLSASDDWSDHAKLFDHGFSAYLPRTLLVRGDVVYRQPVISGTAESVSVVAAQSLQIALSDEEFLALERVIELKPFVYAPVEKGHSAGRIRLECGGEPLAEAELRYAGAVEETHPPGKGFWGWVEGIFK